MNCWLSLLLSLLLSICFFAVAEQRENANQSSILKLKPKMRTVDRKWDYFKSVSCNDINQIVFHSNEEKRLLKKRKNQCLEKYRAFLPSPVDR